MGGGRAIVSSALTAELAVAPAALMNDLGCVESLVGAAEEVVDEVADEAVVEIDSVSICVPV
jgi:hypothetical protein